MQYSVGGGQAGARHLPQCLFCKCRNFDDIWLHYKGCKGVPEEQRKEILEMYENMVSSAGKDWREFLERKFEPHTFRKRWENIAGIHARTSTTRSLVFRHLCVGEIPTRRLPFGMGARNWFVERNTYSRVQPAKPQRSWRGTLHPVSLENSNTTSIGISTTNI